MHRSIFSYEHKKHHLTFDSQHKRMYNTVRNYKSVNRNINNKYCLLQSCHQTIFCLDFCMSKSGTRTNFWLLSCFKEFFISDHWDQLTELPKEKVTWILFKFPIYIFGKYFPLEFLEFLSSPYFRLWRETCFQIKAHTLC